MSEVFLWGEEGGFGGGNGSLQHVQSSLSVFVHVANHKSSDQIMNLKILANFLMTYGRAYSQDNKKTCL